MNNRFLQFPLATIVFGLLMLAYALLNPPMLSLLGFSVATISAGVGLFCYWMWNKSINHSLHEREQYIHEIAFHVARDEQQYATAYKHWFKMKYHHCAHFPQFWSTFILIMYCGFISIASMYLDSLQPPCHARQDCTQAESRGIYIGRALW